MWNQSNSTMNEGGGFLNDTVSGQLEEKTDKRRAQNLVPFMIDHILRYPAGSEFTFWGFPVSSVTIVGILKNIELATTKVTYDIQDETGRIKAMRWLQVDQQPEVELKLNTYVRVYGMVKEQNGVRNILLTKIVPIKQLAEIISHNLEVIYTLQHARAMSEGVIASDANIMQSRVTAGTNFDSGNDMGNGMTKEQELIYNIIKNEVDPDNVGVERSFIKSHVPPNMVSRVDSIIEFLSGEGHIYTTSTDDHFKTT